MDHVLYDEVTHRTMSYYQGMLEDGDSVNRIAFSLDTQLTELVPTCERYRELVAWGDHHLAPEGGRDWRQLGVVDADE